MEETRSADADRRLAHTLFGPTGTADSVEVVVIGQEERRCEMRRGRLRGVYNVTRCAVGQITGLPLKLSSSVDLPPIKK